MCRLLGRRVRGRLNYLDKLNEAVEREERRPARFPEATEKEVSEERKGRLKINQLTIN